MNPPAIRVHRLSKWPPWISHWLGYRALPPAPPKQYIVWFWSFFAAFCGISVIQLVFGKSHYFIERNVPSIVASYVGFKLIMKNQKYFILLLVGRVCSSHVW